jgi:predicted glycogen debranching enzyme
VELVRRLRGTFSQEALLEHEWLVTNGLGGYASGTLACAATRRYHGLLVAALPTPLGRIMMLNQLFEALVFPDGKRVELSTTERSDRALFLPGAQHLDEFRLEDGLPVWKFTVGAFTLERRVFMTHRANTTFILYRLLTGYGQVELELNPAVGFRGNDDPVSQESGEPYVLRAEGRRYSLTGDARYPALKLRFDGRPGALTLEAHTLRRLLYRTEESRGYPAEGTLFSPGYFRVTLAPGEEVALVASTEPWEVMEALDAPSALTAELRRRKSLVSAAKLPADDGIAAELVLAADQFIISPLGRVADAARARAAGDEVRTVIAGYHWFTDWGRDTMISLDGLTLRTGRWLEAGYILRLFALHVRDGLIPNYFPDGQSEGLYHTADATLWLFHALDRYVQTSGDQATLQLLLPTMQKIVAAHLAGTRFGIRVDGRDGLLTQGAEGEQLTWMDAKVDGWVVTPRRGKAVELNALWYRALRVCERWLRAAGDELAARKLSEHAERAKKSFNQRFWYEAGGHLYDVVDGENGDDASLRPNQILSVSLPDAILDEKRWPAVVKVVGDKLLTPVGLRSLSPDAPEYKARYFGDLRTRDAAYHQGTVWSWLIGPYVDAWLRVHAGDKGARKEARKLVDGFVRHLSEACVGSVSEIFDGDAPFAPRGCVAQAWGVAEVLRAWLETAA